MKVGVRAFAGAADGRDPPILLYLLTFFYVGLREVRVLRRDPLAVV